MRIISWNINGIKARYDELMELAHEYQPDLLCLQKVKSKVGVTQFPIEGYDAVWQDCDHSNWSGVATYFKKRSMLLQRINTPVLSRDGHLQLIDCGKFYLANAYVPYNNANIPGAADIRKSWNDKFRSLCASMSAKPMICCGDMNIIHQPIDTWDGIAVKKCGNYHQWEHDDFDKLLADANLVDVFREKHPTLAKYTYFFQNKYKTTNQGGRLDYFLASASLVPFVKSVDMLSDFGFSPSIPIIIDLNL